MKRKKKQFNLNGYIFGALRKIWRWYPEGKIALKVATLGVDDGKYSCFTCGGRFSRKEVHVDHTEPVINPATGFQGWDIYVKRLFVKANKLDILCKPCHKIKTQAENKQRRK